VHSLRGPRKIQFLGHSNEVPKMTKFHGSDDPDEGYTCWVLTRDQNDISLRQPDGVVYLMNREIANLINVYGNALNNRDTKAIISIYGSDPIFMPQNSVAVVGRDSVKSSYERIFATIRLKVTFTIHEIVQLGEDLAYGRTTSEGQQEILATRAQSKEANNELFIFRKEQGQWKIHRYLFATSNPLPPPVRKSIS
jgi:uncharacterized protein (TIGR02246 family)